MEGTLVRLELVEVARVEGEELAAILEAEAQAVRDVAGAPAVIDALDQRDHVAFAVGGGQVGRVGGTLEPAGCDLVWAARLRSISLTRSAA